MKKTKFLFVMLILTGISSCGVKDLRSSSIRKQGITEKQRQKGREILNKTIKAHGGKNWNQENGFSFELYDQWNDPIGKRMAMPIKINETHSQWQVSKDLKQISILYLDGKHEGETWGIDHGEVITNSSAKISDKQQNKAAFYWSAIPYFLMTPSGFSSADIVFYMGEVQLKNGTDYYQVFVSWGTDAPQKDVDQWVLYIDKTNHQLKYADHTLREMMKFMKATAEFSHYIEVNGILIPQKVDVKFSAEGKFIGHEMSYSQIKLIR